MYKMSRKIDENEKMDEWLTEEYLKEADELIQEVLAKEDVLPDEMIDTEGAYEKLLKELGRRVLLGAEEDSELKRKKQFARRRSVRRKRLAKVAGMVLVVGGSIFAASMTSEANRNYFLNRVNYLVGNDVQVNVVNNGDRDKSSIDETEAIRIIEEKLNVEIPTFLYRPYHFDYDTYSIDEAMGIADINYVYKKENIINFRIMASQNEMASGINFYGDIKKEILIENADDIVVQILKIQENSDKTPSFIAQWNKEDTYYQLSGKIDENELVYIIEQMVY